MSNETVIEICEAMKKMSVKPPLEYPSLYISTCADHIIAAHEREELSHIAYVARECAKVKAEFQLKIAAKEEMCRIAFNSAQARFDEKLAEMEADNARLREALKPVLECDLDGKGDRNINCTLMRYHSAIRKAHAAMMGRGDE